MIEFFREDGLAERFRAMRRRARRAFVAAPFWGQGATDLLGLSEGEGVRVLCRHESNGCNPEELLVLQDSGADIRSHPRLHAKIYGTAEQVIVGSSNASRHGITENGDVISGSVEANVLTDDPAVVGEARRLFESLWESPEKIEVTREMILREIALRAEQPRTVSLRTLSATTLVAACREAPELFGTVFIIASAEGLDREAEDALNELKAGERDAPFSPLDGWETASGFQLTQPLPAGAWVVDLDCTGRRPKVWGTSQVPTPWAPMKIARKRDLTVVFANDVRVPGARGTFPLSKAEKSWLAKNSEMFLPFDDGLVSLLEALRLCEATPPATP